MKKLFLILIAPLFLSACVRYIDGYNSDPAIVSALGAYGNKKIRVVDFDSALGEGYASSCRGYNLIATPGKVGLVRYIQNAFISELELAGLYSPDSSLILKGTVTQILVETLEQGKWTIRMTMLSSNGRSISVNEQLPFKANIAGQYACQTASDMYPYAVRNLIRKLVTAPGFKLLLGPSTYPKAPPPESKQEKAKKSSDTKEEPVEEPQPIPQMQIQPAPAKPRRKTETKTQPETEAQTQPVLMEIVPENAETAPKQEKTGKTKAKRTARSKTAPVQEKADSKETGKDAGKKENTNS